MKYLGTWSIEHVPYADKATVAFVIHDEVAFVWLDADDRCNLVFEVAPREPFVDGGVDGVRDVLSVLDEMLEDTLTEEQVAFARDALPVVKNCLPRRRGFSGRQQRETA